MDHVFINILNNGLITSFLILAIILLRLVLKKAPRWINCALWALVAIKLLLPVKIRSLFSLIPSAEPIPGNIESNANPHITTGIPTVNSYLNPIISEHFAPKPEASVNPLQVVFGVATAIWIAGIIIALLYFAISYFVLKRTVSASVKAESNVYMCDEVASPFILGIIKPAIYVPSGIDDDTLACVLEHERAHLKRHDNLWKPVSYLLLAIYWFNPFCWVAYILLSKDIELACDEKVNRDKDTAWKARYCEALLEYNKQRKNIAACPLAFGELSVKERVKRVINYKKPSFWLIILSAVLMIGVMLCFMTTPQAKDGQADMNTDYSDDYDWSLNIDTQTWASLYAYRILSGDDNNMSEQLLNDFKENGFLDNEKNQISLSEISPQNYMYFVKCTSSPDEYLIIYYVADENNHVNVWTENIKIKGLMTEYSESYQLPVVGEHELVKHDNIASASEYDECYENGFLSTYMNYWKNQLMDECIKKSGNAEIMSDPYKAAIYLLNLSNDENKVKLELTNNSTNEKVVNISIKFIEDNEVRYISMVKPWDNLNAWIPADFQVKTGAPYQYVTDEGSP